MKPNQEPETGAVTGDTWKEFQRAFKKTGKNRDIYCEVVKLGDAEPIQGTTYRKGRILTVALSVENIPAIRLTNGPTDDGLIIDLELALFSLLLCELEGIPVARQYLDVQKRSLLRQWSLTGLAVLQRS